MLKMQKASFKGAFLLAGNCYFREQLNHLMKYALYLSFLLLPIVGLSQGFAGYGDGIKIKIDKEGDRYLRFITWHQVWMRYNQNNAGSTRNGVAQRETFDIGLRRSRIQLYSQINKRFLVFMHFGINNQNAISGGLNGQDGKKPQVFVHDAWVDYTVIPKYLHLGAGLHYWNGLSRMSNASTLNFMTMDAPILNWPMIETLDQFARKLGLFAKGKVGKLSYQIALNEPFQFNGSPGLNRADFNSANNSKLFESYLQFEFWEPENNRLPFRVGSYLGTKRILNFGAGFVYGPNAMVRGTQIDPFSGLINAGDTLDMSCFAIDAFMDLPLKNKDALTAYAALYLNDLGPNYLRNIGILNPSNGSNANHDLRGNALPTIGTGRSFYTQIGYMLPKKRDDFIWQPYGALIYSDFEGLINSTGAKVPVTVLDLGINLYLAGHHSKLTLNYRNRPDMVDLDDPSRKAEITLQAMVYL